jgi:predicted dehydrogenase
VEALGAAVLGGHEDLAQARLTFADGCVADFRASRVHPKAVRRLQAWGPEGYAAADFAARRLTLMQPAEHLRQGRLDSRRLDPAALASLKAELFGRHIQVREVACQPCDQLTRELREFVHCARTGAAPRADGAAGREAVALACRVLEAIRGRRGDAAAARPLFADGAGGREAA